MRSMKRRTLILGKHRRGQAKKASLSRHQAVRAREEPSARGKPASRPFISALTLVSFIQVVLTMCHGSRVLCCHLQVLSGSTVVVNINAGDSVGTLQARIEEATRIRCGEQYVLFQGRRLAPAHRLVCKCGIANEATLAVVVVGKGGASPEPGLEEAPTVPASGVAPGPGAEEPLIQDPTNASTTEQQGGTAEVRVWGTFQHRSSRHVLSDLESGEVRPKRAAKSSSASSSSSSAEDVEWTLHGLLLGTAASLQQRSVRHGRFTEFLDASLRGVGQIFFASNPVTGLVVLVTALVASYEVGVGLLLGVVTATATAQLVGFDDGSRRAGLLGYAGSLTVAGMFFFAEDPLAQPWLLASAVILGTLSCILTISIGSILAARLGIAPFTLPFHAALWMWLLACQQAAHFSTDASVITPKIIPPSPSHSPPVAYEIPEVIRAIFTSVSQVVFIENPFAGAAILCGLATYSRISAIAGLLGSFVGVLGAMALGVAPASLYAGLWGFNPCLVGIALGGVFFVPRGWRMLCLWLLALLCSVLVHGACTSALAPTGMPPLTMPASLTCIAFCLLAGTTRSVVAVQLDAITVPEDHRRRYRVSKAVARQLTGPTGVVSQTLGRNIGKDTLYRLEEHLVPALLCSLTAATACSETSLDSRRKLEQLLVCGADPSAADYDGRTPLHIAACTNDTSTATLLLRYGGSLQAEDRMGNTPLLDAVTHGSAAVVSLFVRRGAGVGATARAAGYMCSAAFRNDVAALGLFIEAGCSVHACDYDQRTALHLACAAGNVDAAAFLLRHGANAHALDRYGETPLATAERSGRDDLTRLFQDSGLPLDTFPPEAATLGEIDASAQGDLISTVLFCDAAAQGSGEVLELMLAASPHLVHSVDYDGRSALHVAAAEGKVPAAELLLNAGANRHERDRWGMTPLVAALLEGHEEMASLLATPNDPPPAFSSQAQQTRFEQAIFEHAAAGTVHLALLFKHRAVAVDTSDYDARTPLHIACACGHDSLARALLLAGVPPAPRDRWDTTPEDDARKAGLERVAQFIHTQSPQ